MSDVVIYSGDLTAFDSSSFLKSESSLAMDASSSHQSDSTSMVSGASKYLANLPSRGFLSSTVVSSNPGGMRVYLCVHDTAAPDDQDIKTNQENILIRSLMLRNNSLKDAKGATATEPSRKRVAEKISDNRGKKTHAQLSSTQEGPSSSKVPAKDLHCLTVDRLRAFLKERGLSPKGKKDELIARLKGADS